MDCILHADPDEGSARAVAAAFAGEFRIVHCPDPSRALGEARRHGAKALILDPVPPGGLGLLAEILRAGATPPVIVHSADCGPEAVFAVARLGAAAFVPKPPRLDELRAAIVASLVPESARRSPFVGRSPAILRAAELLHRYAASPYPVLLLGESGTGKDLAARAVHELSGRRGRLVARNCAAFPGELAESELFGSEKGAFTGALGRPGAMELAAGGTLFLDEIGEAGAAFQPKLLRALESGEYWRLGGTCPRRSDFRLVSATSRDLRAEAAAGRFRADLLYRIAILVLELPPLRERLEDLPELAAHFLSLAAPGRKRLSASAVERLAEAPWPGNVRELRNAILRASVLSGRREEILPGDIEL